MKKLPIILLILLCACYKDKPGKCWKFAGDEVTETREVGYFNRLIISDQIDVYIRQDTFYSVSVTAGENLIPWVETGLSGNTLTIKDLNKCNFLRSYENRLRVDIVLRDLEHIEYSGTGNIYIQDTLRVPSLLVNAEFGSGTMDITIEATEFNFQNHTGPFDLNAHGIVQELALASAGNGFLDASGVTAQRAYCNNRGTGDFHVNIWDYLYVDISHTGDVYYAGTPGLIDLVDTGSGQLINE